MTNSAPSDANRQIARAAGVVMTAFVVSQLTGLVRIAVVAPAFGAGTDLDAFGSANRVSETLFLLVAGGALSSAFIPTFTGLLARRESEKAWKLASAVANLVLLILAAASILAAIFAPQVVRYALAPGFVEKPEAFQLTVNLLRLMLPSAAIFALSGLVMAVLNSHQVFLVPALTPSMYQLGQIFGVLVLARRMNMGIYGLGWGVLIGSVLHLGLQIPSLLRLRGRYTPTLSLDMPEVREVARLMGPRLLGVAVVQLNFWINTNLASRMLPGSVSAITLSFALMLMPQAALAQSLATAAMPTFSAQVALNQEDQMRRSLGTILRWMVLAALPATVGLVMLRFPVVRLVYERGNFTPEDTQMVAWALLWYALGLVAHSLVEILSRAFYALHDTRTPVLVGSVVMGLNAGLSIIFAALFTRWGWMPHGGLALANTVATGLEMVALLYLMSRRLHGLEARRIMLGLGQASAASLVMALAVWGWLGWSAQLPVWLSALGGVALGGGIFALGLVVLRVEEIRQVYTLLRSRLGRISG